MRSAATSVNYIYKIKITQQFRRLGLSLIVTFPLASSKTAHNNRCGHFPYKVGGSCCREKPKCINMGYSCQKVKKSHYRHGQAQRFRGGWGSQIPRQSAHVDVRVASPTHRPPLPPEVFLVIISVRGWVEPRTLVRPKGLFQTPTGIQLPTFLLVGRCLNKQRNGMPLLFM